MYGMSVIIINYHVRHNQDDNKNREWIVRNDDKLSNKKFLSTSNNPVGRYFAQQRQAHAWSEHWFAMLGDTTHAP